MAPRGGLTASRVDEGNDDRAGFDVEWLENCYKRVSFPNPKCEDFMVEVNRRLSHKVRGELDNPVKQQALFELLGEDFVRMHFPHHRFSPELLRPPRTTPDVRRAYLMEMRTLIQDQMSMAQREMNMPEDVSTYDGNDELGEFLREVRMVFSDEMGRQIELEASGDAAGMTNEEDDEDEEERERAKRHSKNEQRRANKARVNDIQEEDEEEGEAVEVRRPFRSTSIPAEAFLCLSNQTSFVSRDDALASFKQANLMLPNPFRKSYWQECIYRNKRSYTKEEKRRRKREKPQKEEPVDVDSVRRQFRSDVNKRIDLKKIHRAVQSTDYKKIYAAVIDSYHNTQVLKPLADDAFMLQSAHVVNVCNVVNRSYSNAQILLLAPLQIVFAQEDGEADEEAICRLANDLNLLLDRTHLGCWDVFHVTDKVVKQLSMEDPEYLDHLSAALAEKPVPVNVYDFAYEILDPDTKKSIKIWNDLYKKKKKDWKEKDLTVFTDLALYLRKWASEAFVGVLSRNSILYVWDLLFLNKWRGDIFFKVCMAILYLIKPWAMKANTHKKISRILLDEPGKIYVGDLRQAMASLAEDRPLQDIRTTNFVPRAEDEQDQDVALLAGVDEEQNLDMNEEEGFNTEEMPDADVAEEENVAAEEEPADTGDADIEADPERMEEENTEGQDLEDEPQEDKKGEEEEEHDQEAKEPEAQVEEDQEVKDNDEPEADKEKEKEDDKQQGKIGEVAADKPKKKKKKNIRTLSEYVTTQQAKKGANVKKGQAAGEMGDEQVNNEEIEQVAEGEEAEQMGERELEGEEGG